MTKYASVSNGSNGILNTSSNNQLANGNSANNLNSNNNNSNVSNLMRSFLTSSNNPAKLNGAHQNRSYFNHLNSSNNNSAINLFTENDQSTYSFKPAEATLNNFNTSLNSSINFYDRNIPAGGNNNNNTANNNSLITASISNNLNNTLNSTAIRHANGATNVQIREKLIAQQQQQQQQNSNNIEKASRENSKTNSLRKENSFYVSVFHANCLTVFGLFNFGFFFLLLNYSE